jgi:hypothetical protein
VPFWLGRCHQLTDGNDQITDRLVVLANLAILFGQFMRQFLVGALANSVIASVAKQSRHCNMLIRRDCFVTSFLAKTSEMTFGDRILVG